MINSSKKLKLTKAMDLPRRLINSDLHLQLSCFLASLLQFFFFKIDTQHRVKSKTTVESNFNNYKPVKYINRDDAIRRDQSNPSYHMLFGGLLMILALVAVGTKKLAFGITVSAFLLLVLEYVGLQFIFQSAMYLGFRSQEDYPYVSNKLLETCNDDSVIHTNSSTSSGENDIVDQISSCCHISGNLVTLRNVLDEKKTALKEEDFRDIMPSGIANRRSRRAILKSKIIHILVPKKLRHSKNRKGTEGKMKDHYAAVKIKEEGTNSIGILTIRQVICESEPESEECNSFHLPLGAAKVDDRKQTVDLSLQSDHSLKSEAESEEIFRSGHSSYEFAKSCDASSRVVASNTEIDDRGKSRYAMFVVIVLAGLIGGRILSFLLAVGYCCILEYICKLRRKESGKQVFISCPEMIRYTV